MYFKIIILVSTLIFWPLNLYLENTFLHFIHYFVPGILVLLSLLLYKKYPNLFITPIIVIPFVEPKLALFPVLLTLANFLTVRNKGNLIYITIALFVFIFSFKPFWGQTIFVSDYEAKQQVIRDTQLYPSIIMARTLHNKARIVTDKFIYNTFALTDPNNYFFGFHPRQLVGGQNLIKYPFLTIIPFLYGLYYLFKKKRGFFMFGLLISGVISLSFLTLFDGNDFILWFPLFLIILEGISVLSKNKKLSKIYILLFLVVLIPEMVRIFIR